VEPFPDGFREEAFINKSHLVTLESWGPEALRPWQTDPQEDYHQTVGPTLKLKLKSRASTEEIKKLVSFGVKQILRSDPAIRSKTVNWVFTELPESLSQEELNGMLRPVWNGMRRLPYTDGEIADAFGSVAALLMIRSGRLVSLEGQMMFSECFGECMHVGFSYQDKSGSVGFATRESLRRSLRPGLIELLTPEFKERANDVRELFLMIYNPKLMFEFDEFKGMFAREVIPAQVVLQRSLILFNPARLMIFGIP
jgi:hypothetical protein